MCIETTGSKVVTLTLYAIGIYIVIMHPNSIDPTVNFKPLPMLNYDLYLFLFRTGLIADIIIPFMM